MGKMHSDKPSASTSASRLAHAVEAHMPATSSASGCLPDVNEYPESSPHWSIYWFVSSAERTDVLHVATGVAVVGDGVVGVSVVGTGVDGASVAGAVVDGVVGSLHWSET